MSLLGAPIVSPQAVQFAAALPTHVAEAFEPTVLQAIRHASTTLAIWKRCPPVRLDRFGTVANLRFVSAQDAVAERLDAALAQSRDEWRRHLIADAAMLAGRYAAATGIDRLDLRLDRVTDNGCSRFHSDYVGIRLVTTYAGRGTQWLAQGDDAAASPFELAPGDVGLFKGRLLAGDTAIVHRSPPIAGGGEDRLLLVIDAAPPPLAAGA